MVPRVMIWQGLRKLFGGAPAPESAVEASSQRGRASAMGLSCGKLSITGNFRENNEDRFFVDEESRFFLVADGMGGQSAGERASELAVELISQKLKTAIDYEKSSSSEVVEAIDRAVGTANAEIMALGELETKCRNMGTTISFVVVVGKRMFVGGVGDSRVYLLRDQELKQLTRDHSLTQALLEAGTISAEEAANHRYKNVLYRYLGSKDGGTGTEPTLITPQPGDILMLCSDGVYDGASPDKISAILKSNRNPQKASEEIVKAAQDGGSKDNITCVVIHVK